MPNSPIKHGFAPKHGKRANIYRRWQHMIQRCHNPNDKDYPRYGGRGITVCFAWRNSFSRFMSDMGLPPLGNESSLERTHNNKGYSYANCYWATAKSQANNRRNTIYLTIRGVTLPLSAWCEIAGVGSKAVLYRLKHTSMTHEEALYTPFNHGNTFRSKSK